MALLSRARVSALLLGLALASVACAGLRMQEYGEQGFPHQRFLELDSTLGLHIGHRVLVRAQAEVGQRRPVQGRPSAVTFHGDIAGLDDGWVHLLRSSDDTVRVGKGNVVGVWLTQGPRDRTPATLLGAAIVGGATLVLIQTRSPADRPSQGVQVGIVGAATLGGAIIGYVLGGGERRGARLYPAPPPPRDTSGQR